MCHPDDAGDVCVEDERRVVADEILGLGVAADNAGVVDDPVDPPLVCFDVGGGLRNRRVVGHVDRHEAHAEPASGRRAPLRVTRTEDDGVAEFGQAAGGLVAEALIRSSDEGNRGHASTLT